MLFADWLDSLPALVMFSLLFGGGIITGIVTAIASNWRKAKESEHLTILKQSLAERGMSVEEIERVVRATPDAKKLQADAPPVAELTQLLADVEDLSPEDLERILRLFQSCDAETQRTMIRTLESMWPSDGSSPDPQKLLAALRALAPQGGQHVSVA